MKQCENCMWFDENYDNELASEDDCVNERVDVWGKRYHYCYKWLDARSESKSGVRVDEIRDSRIPDEIADNDAECPYFVSKYPPEGAEDLWQFAREAGIVK